VFSDAGMDQVDGGCAVAEDTVDGDTLAWPIAAAAFLVLIKQRQLFLQSSSG
jgi:hypothetical protein